MHNRTRPFAAFALSLLTLGVAAPAFGQFKFTDQRQLHPG